MTKQNEPEKWPELSWDQVVDRVFPSVFKVETEYSSGTAFVFSISRVRENGKHYTFLATAWHVLSNEIGTKSPLSISSSDGERQWTSEKDKIFLSSLGPKKFDTALIMIESHDPLISIDRLLPVPPFDTQLARGANIGWLGYPGITEPEICFFSGHISGYLNDPPSYLVDGVAVNGVSGGPVFDNRCHLIGMMTAYIPNYIDETRTLPGLSSVTPINAIRFFAEQQLRATVL